MCPPDCAECPVNAGHSRCALSVRPGELFPHQVDLSNFRPIKGSSEMRHEATIESTIVLFMVLVEEIIVPQN
jgi:hypothetical protein